jgi:hypothetical protein
MNDVLAIADRMPTYKYLKNMNKKTVRRVPFARNVVTVR